MPRTGTRPTTDRVRESLFNVLASRIDFAGASVLDLYAGSGALGLEALSRGADIGGVRRVRSPGRRRHRPEHRVVGVTGRTVRRGPSQPCWPAARDRPVDLVFADPPYDVGDTEIAADAHRAGRRRLGEHGHGGGCRAGRVGAVADWPDGWQPWQARRYGDTRLELAERI